MTPRPEEQAVTHCDVLNKSHSDLTTRVPSADSATAGASGPTCIPSLPAHDGRQRQRQWLLSWHTWGQQERRSQTAPDIPEPLPAHQLGAKGALHPH